MLVESARRESITDRQIGTRSKKTSQLPNPAAVEEIWRTRPKPSQQWHVAMVHESELNPDADDAVAIGSQGPGPVPVP